MNRRQMLHGLAVGLLAAGDSGAWSVTPDLVGGASRLPGMPLPGVAPERDWVLSTRALGAALLAQQADTNAVLSPLSIWGALAMVFAGARGDTAQEMAHALKMPNQASAFAQGWQQARALQQSQSPALQLLMANRVWLQKDLVTLPEFEQLLRQGFGAELGRSDFVGAPDAARQDINTWVAQQTAQQIQNLLQPDSVTPMTRLVLTQAVYLKAAWRYAFDRAQTRDEAFTLTQGQSVQVPFMHQTRKHLAGLWQSGDAQAQLIELPYADGGLSMLIAVPQQARHLPAVLDLLRQDWRAYLSMRQVTLSLPRWKARSSLSLRTALSGLGMGRLFEAGQADLSGIHGRRDLVVSAVVHQAMVEVSEQGTEAAAATAVALMTKSAEWLAPPMDIRVNRPYAWAIVDAQQRSLLFAGLVRDPR